MKKNELIQDIKNPANNTKMKIMEATLQLLWQNGFKGTTTKQIAKIAGVNEVTIFRNFRNKENLIEETFKHSETMTDPLKELLKKEFNTVRDFLDKFSNMIFIQFYKNKEMHLSCLKEIGNKKSEYVKNYIDGHKYIIKLFNDKLHEMHKQGKIKKSYIKNLSNIYHSSTLAVFIWHSVNGKETSDKDIKNYLKNLSKILTHGIE